MPTKNEVYIAADGLHARGIRVSLRNLIPALRFGGSNREVGPHLRDWKVERVYRPELEPKDLAERLLRLLAKATSELWAAAQVEAAKLLEVERRAATEKERAGDDVLHEALALLDVAEAEAAHLRERLARYGDRIAAEAVPLTA